MDEAIEELGHVFNLRAKLLQAVVEFETERAEEQQQRSMTEAICALSRYFKLICFESYLEHCESSHSGDMDSDALIARLSAPNGFSRWMDERGSLERLWTQFSDSASFEGLLRSHHSEAEGSGDMTLEDQAVDTLTISP